MGRTIENGLRRWYIPLIVGVIFILTAIGIYSVPRLSLSVLMLLFSIMITGFAVRESVLVYARRKLIKGWGWYFAGALLAACLGLALLGNTFLSLAYLNALIGILFIGKALQNIVLYFTSYLGTARFKGMNFIYSIALIFIAVILLLLPQIIGTVLITLSGFLFLLVGVACIGLSMALRISGKRLKAFKESFRNKTEDAVYEIVH